MGLCTCKTCDKHCTFEASEIENIVKILFRLLNFYAKYENDTIIEITYSTDYDYVVWNMPYVHALCCCISLASSLSNSHTPSAPAAMLESTMVCRHHNMCLLMQK